MESTEAPKVPREKEFGEKEAGIEENMSSHTTEKPNVVISCAIKHRFSDFIVNEIDENGNVLWFQPEKDL